MSLAKIVISDRADNDLLDIWAFVAADSISAADRLLDLIEERWQQLRRNPRSGVARNDIADGVRHLVASSYLILYRISGDDIEIVRVLHASRRLSGELLE